LPCPKGASSGQNPFSQKIFKPNAQIKGNEDYNRHRA
jgi:hypothetical protein